MPPRADAKPAARKSKASKPAEKGMTKSQLFSELAADAELTKSQVSSVFSALLAIVEREIKHGRPVTVPGLVKATVKSKPATPSRMGRNPFTGEEIMIKAKPARKVVKVRPVKALKDMA